MSSMLTFLSERRLRWLDHVRRMRPVRIPKDLVYGELAEGSLLTGRPRLHFQKKRHETAVSMSAHGISVRLTLQPGALLSERVYRGPRKRETKTSLKSGPGREGETTTASAGIAIHLQQTQQRLVLFIKTKIRLHESIYRTEFR